MNCWHGLSGMILKQLLLRFLWVSSGMFFVIVFRYDVFWYDFLVHVMVNFLRKILTKSQNPFDFLIYFPFDFSLDLLFRSKFCLLNRRTHAVDGRALNR